jgi:hypothetical protein
MTSEDTKPEVEETEESDAEETAAEANTTE